MDDSDVHLAVQLSDVKTTGLSNSVLTTLDVFMDVNLKPLPLISTNNIFHRVPGVHRRRPTNPDPQNQKPSANTNTTATPGHNISNPPSGDNTNQNPSQLPITSIPVDLLNRNFSFVPGVEAYPPPPKVNPNPASNLQRYNPSSAKKQRTGGINRSSSSTSQNPSSGSSTPQYTVQYLSEEERQLNRKQQQMEYAKL